MIHQETNRKHLPPRKDIFLPNGGVILQPEDELDEDELQDGESYVEDEETPK